MAVTGLSSFLRDLGHEPVGVVTTPLGGERYGGETLGEIVEHAATGIDVLVAASPSRIGPLLGSLDADVAICAAFPLLLPADALDVPRLGIVNTHPSLLPRYRGPNPIAWAVRNGDREMGYSIHRMDNDFDTGHLLAQGTAPIHDAERPEAIFTRIFGLLGSLLPEALARVQARDPGDPQPAEGASYAGFFEPEYAEIDWAQPASQIRRQVLAWRVAAVRGPASRGALTTVGGQRVRVLRMRDDDGEGGTQMECADGPLWLVEVEPA
jgi:methionyl-tRNA formyltransferase